jgi:hypothetical protein
MVIKVSDSGEVACGEIESFQQMSRLGSFQETGLLEG